MIFEGDLFTGIFFLGFCFKLRCLKDGNEDDDAIMRLCTLNDGTSTTLKRSDSIAGSMVTAGASVSKELSDGSPLRSALLVADWEDCGLIITGSSTVTR